MTSPNQSLAPEGPHQPLQAAQRSRLPSVGVRLPEPPVRDEDVIDLRELWAVLMRRRWLIISVVSLAAILALVATFVMTPIYRSTLLLQIETTGNRVVDYGSVTQEETTGYRANMDFYRTQYELLKSNTLARRVIDQLGLVPMDADEEGPSFFGDMGTMAKAWVSSMSGASATGDALSGVDPEQAQRMNEEIALLEQLTIEPVRDSRLVRIHYDSPGPVEAAEVANAVATNFINLNLERRYDASSFAKRFLEEQLAQARATLEESEKRFVAYAREREIVDTDNRLQITLDNLREMNSQLIKAQGARIEAEAVYFGIVNAGGAGSAAGVLESKLIQSLKERRGTMEADYRDQLQVFKPNYPSMRQLKQQIDELDQQIARETSAIAGGVKAQYEAKSLEEAKLSKRIMELNEEALALQDRSTDFETLRREVTTNRELYDGLLQRVKEVGVAAGIGENNISIVDAARVPIAPFKPSLKLNLAIAIALGGFIGVLAAFLLEALDDTVRGAEDVEGLVGAPVLTLIPKVDARELGLRGRRARPARLPGPEEFGRRVGAFTAHPVVVFDVRRCPRHPALYKRGPWRRQDNHGHQYGDCVCTGGQHRPADRLRLAQPFVAACVHLAQHEWSDELSGRQCEAARDLAGDHGDAPLCDYQRAAPAEPGRAARECENAGSVERCRRAFRHRDHRRATRDRACRCADPRESGEGDDLHRGCPVDAPTRDRKCRETPETGECAPARGRPREGRARRQGLRLRLRLRLHV
nr:GumC family protein [Thiocapsa sp.]